MKKAFVPVVIATLLCLCGCCARYDSPVKSTLSVDKVQNLPDDFWLGADVSSVVSLENSGVCFYGFDGKRTDLLKVLSDNGVNIVRVRLWVDPFDTNGNGYGGGNCNTDVAIAIAKRAKSAGLRLFVDFHYSDFWADPSKQQCPKAWTVFSFEQKRQALADYTLQTLQQIEQTGVSVAAVQIGNEINGGLCGEKDWDKVCSLISVGAQAVRQFNRSVKVAVHFTDPQKKGNLDYFASVLSLHGVDYDVFAVSYYSYWHGTTKNLSATLWQIAQKYGKQVMVVETAHPFTDKDSDFFVNNVSASQCIYQVSEQGQANSFRDVVESVNDVGGIGVFYWEPAWISVGQTSCEQNKVKWQRYGSGWATSYASEYSSDAASYYGGSSWDNQALFDATGNPLQSLKVFLMVRFGTKKL